MAAGVDNDEYEMPLGSDKEEPGDEEGAKKKAPRVTTRQEPHCLLCTGHCRQHVKMQPHAALTQAAGEASSCSQSPPHADVCPKKQKKRS